VTESGPTAAATAGPGGGRWSSVLVALSLVVYGLIVGTVGGVATARLAGYPVSPVVAPFRGGPEGRVYVRCARGRDRACAGGGLH
jgi:hypothetical protein